MRLVLTPRRAQWLQAAYRQHAVKTIVTARHVMGLRAAAFLTAGMARVPFWKFVVADAGTAALGVPFLFGLAYFFTDEITAIVADVHRVERWLALAGLLVLAAVLVVGVRRWHRRLGRERRDAEQTAGQRAATAGSPGAVSRLESTPLALGVGNACDEEPVQAEFPNAQVRTRRDDTEAY